MPGSVMGTEFDPFWQAFFTYVSWGIALLMVVVAIRMGQKQRTPFYLFAVLAAGVGAFAEPIYDVVFDLWFYDVANGETGAMWSHYSAFGIVQPVWTHSGYIILYAGMALYAGRRMYEGRMTSKALFGFWALEIVTSCVFEVIGTATLYSYYGPYELRVFDYPLVIGFLEGTQVVLFTVVAVQFWKRVRTGWGLAGLFAIHPLVMFGANIGIGWPIIVALHLDGDEFSRGAVWVATLLTMALCAVAVRGATLFLPQPAEAPTPAADVPPQRTTTAGAVNA